MFIEEDYGVEWSKFVLKEGLRAYIKSAAEAAL